MLLLMATLDLRSARYYRNACNSFRAPAVTMSTAEVATLIELLADSTSTLPDEAAAAITALEAIQQRRFQEYDGLDYDPSGRWKVLSYDPLRARLSKLSTTLASPCEVFVENDGPADFQSECRLTMDVIPSGGDSPVRVNCRGVIAQGEEAISVIWLRAGIRMMTDAQEAERALQMVESAISPSLPPGAIRCKLRIAWLSSELVVLRDSASGVAVLQRQPEPDGEADAEGEQASPSSAGDGADDDDEADESELWVGSPY